MDISRTWDVAVIGTGMGGAVAGRRLAMRGLSVIFIERGDAACESQYQVPARVDASEQAVPLFSGIGGLSARYAAAFERPERHDLDDTPDRPHPTGGWPVGFDRFAPYFAETERMFEVCGDRGPRTVESELRPPPPLSDQDEEFCRKLRQAGALPYRCPLALRFVPGCNECFAQVCPQGCKRDAKAVGIDVALKTGCADVLCDAEVTRISLPQAGANVTLHVRGKDGEREITARRVVVAAGAVGSPRILLNSRSEAWPNGIGNRNDLVGRGLMCHLTELLAVWPGGRASRDGAKKAFSFRDAYYRDGSRLGLVQSLGLAADYPQVLGSLDQLLRRLGVPAPRLALQSLKVPAYLVSRVLGSAKIYAGILEDLPRHANRVTLDGDDYDRVSVVYDIPDELLIRRALFRREMKRLFAGWNSLFLSWQPAPNWWHACGTLRFGHSPTDSVLDADCRVHGTDSVFVSDASFMPTSMGVNPSLIISANALRVADAVAASFAGRA